MAYTYNPNYWAGRDQENQGLKSAQENSSRDLIKKGCWSGSSGGAPA
jgi:hypothetical protein